MADYITIEGRTYSIQPAPELQPRGSDAVVAQLFCRNTRKLAGQVVKDSAQRTVLTGPEFSRMSLWNRLIYGKTIASGDPHMRVIPPRDLQRWWCVRCERWVPADMTQVVDGPHGIRNHTVTRSSVTGPVLVHHTVCAGPSAA